VVEYGTTPSSRNVIQHRYDHAGSRQDLERILAIMDALTVLRRDDEIMHIAPDPRTQQQIIDHFMTGASPQPLAAAQPYPEWVRGFLRRVLDGRRDALNEGYTMRTVPHTHALSIHMFFAILRRALQHATLDVSKLITYLAEWPMRQFFISLANSVNRGSWITDPKSDDEDFDMMSELDRTWTTR
jgi:hypothetical protein